jgi:hypothetical protein
MYCIRLILIHIVLTFFGSVYYYYYMNKSMHFVHSNFDIRMWLKANLPSHCPNPDPCQTLTKRMQAMFTSMVPHNTCIVLKGISHRSASRRCWCGLGATRRGRLWSGYPARTQRAKPSTKLRTAAGLGILVFDIQQFPLHPSYVPRCE